MITNWARQAKILEITYFGLEAKKNSYEISFFSEEACSKF